MGRALFALLRAPLLLLLRRTSFAFFAHSGSVSIPLTRLPPSLTAASRMPPDPNCIGEGDAGTGEEFSWRQSCIKKVRIVPFDRIYPVLVMYQQVDMLWQYRPLIIRSDLRRHLGLDPPVWSRLEAEALTLQDREKQVSIACMSSSKYTTPPMVLSLKEFNLFSAPLCPAHNSPVKGLWHGCAWLISLSSSWYPEITDQGGAWSPGPKTNSEVDRTMDLRNS